MSRPLTRRQWIASVAGAGVGVGLAAGWTWAVRRAFTHAPEQLTVTRHVFGIGTTVPDTPGASTPSIRVMQLSDLHLRSIGAREERVVAAVEAHRPDLIVFTGDAIDGSADLPVLAELLALLRPSARKLAVVGDRDRRGVDLRALERTYARRGCELLVNDVAEFQVGGRRVMVTGLDDLISGRPDPGRALAGAAPAVNHLLLAHCPAQRDRLRWERVRPVATAGITDGPEVDLAPFRPQWMLAGHTHGGQIAPFGWPLFRPRGSGRYVSGWYRDGVPALYVSRGIGTSTIPARHRVPPEVPVFDWRLG
jgi:predicted MPP superfamily phosphohydrolase